MREVFAALFKTMPARAWAVLAGIYSGIVFGTYWIPARQIESAGIPGLWAVVVFSAAAFVLLIPWLLAHRQLIWPIRPRIQIATCMAGLSFMLYMGGLIYTEVVRALVLFYLMPIWGFILARIVLGEVITPLRALSMGFGLTGLVIICGVAGNIPIPDNTGDWMALASGLIWAGACLMIFTDQHQPAAYAVNFLGWSLIWSVVVSALATGQGALALPDWGRLHTLLIWLIPFALLVTIPAAFTTLYAPTQLNPGIVGLLFMSEISIGTATAAIWAGEPFGLREITGVLLITFAGISEPVWQWLSKPPGKQPE